MPVLAINKFAQKDYQILEKMESGLVLSGAEVKSAKNRQIIIKNSYVFLDNNQEVWLVNGQISHYLPAKESQNSYDPGRNRKLLLTKKEIHYLLGKKQTGLTIVPLSVYTKGSLIKVEIALAKAKKKFDKREELKKRDVNREIRRKMRGKY